MPILNRTWTVYFSSLPSFEADSQRNLPLIALICWLTLSFLLFGITCAEGQRAAPAPERITAELRKSEAALAAEKERLAVTLYSIGDGVITTDTAGCVLSINKVAEQLTGWPQHESALKAARLDVQNTSRKVRGSLRPVHWKRLCNRGKSCSLAKPALLIARDGFSERVIADSAAPIRNREGGIIGAVVVFPRRDRETKNRGGSSQGKQIGISRVAWPAASRMILIIFFRVLLEIFPLARMNTSSIRKKILDRLAAMEKSALQAKDLTRSSW